MSWFAACLDSLKAVHPAPSMLELGCGDGIRLAQSMDAGVQPFGVEPDPTLRAAARARCPGAYVAAAAQDLPPHRFDLILLSESRPASELTVALYELAAKDAFGPETLLVATAPLPDTAATLHGLRFHAAEQQDGRIEARGSDLGQFMQERYIPGTWSEIAAYEHLPRYAYACGMAQDARVLDFGCGSGYGAAALAAVARTVTALDISEEALAFARTRHTAPNLAFVHDDAFGASLPEGGFDLIACFEVIEHLDEPGQAALLRSLRRLLAPGGRMLVSTPNPLTTALYGQNPYHLRELTGEQFEAVLRQHFPHVAIVEQSIQVSIVLNPSGHSGPLAVQDGVAGLAGTAPPAIFVALCGLLPLEPPPALVFLDRARDFISQRTGGLRQRDEQLVARHALVQAQAEMTRLRSSLDASVASAAVLDTDRHRLEAELAAVQSELSAVLADRALIQQTVAAHDAEAARLRATAAAAQAELAAVLADRALVQQTAAAHEADAARLRAVAATTEAELAAVLADRALVQHTLAAQEADTARLRITAAAAEAELVAMRADHLAQQTVHQALLSRHESLQAAHRAAQCEAAGLKERLGAVEVRQADLRAGAHRAEAGAAALAAQLAATQAEARALRTARDDAQAALAAADSRSETLASQLAGAEATLAVIQSSTTWRAARRAQPMLRAARPALRPVARLAWRIMRRLRAATSERPISNATPGAAPEAAPAAVPARDLLLETSLDPVWDHRRQAYVLQPDPGFVQPAGNHGLVGPYVVRPIGPIDATASRPLMLHVIPNVHVGGSTQLVIDLVQHLSDLFRHEVLTSSLWPGGTHEGLEVHLVPTPDPDAMADILGTLRPAVVHMHYWGLTDDPWYIAALEAMHRHPCPAVQNINTPIAPLVDPAFRHYVFVSDYVRKTFGVAVPGEQTSVIHPGIDLERFGALSPAPGREEAIGMVYRLEDDKLNEDAIDVFIEVVRRRPRTKVYIVGGGRFLLPYLERTERAGVRANFRFTGYVPYDTLPQWYDRFAIFVAPVWKESFGQVVPFAMMKGAAVAGFDVGALPEILGGHDTLGPDVDKAASIIAGLLADPDHLRDTGRRNRARAMDLFGVEAMVARYRAVYRAVLDLRDGQLDRYRADWNRE